LARKFGGRGRHVVVSAYGSFHGRTLAALAATGQPAKHEPFFPMPDGFRHVPFGDLAAAEQAIDPSVSAILIETVQGEGGVIPAEPAYLEGLRRLCDERELLLIVDEVQTGVGRTGTFYAHTHDGITADIVTGNPACGRQRQPRIDGHRRGLR
jgi:acetylornithine/succinyldiaminopimelate/putrescine aminotransferase